MRNLDIIMELLADSSWHSIEEIKTGTHLKIEMIDELIDFLHELDFIEKDNDDLKITEKGLKFLDINC